MPSWPHGSFLCTHNSPVASSGATQGSPITQSIPDRHGQSPQVLCQPLCRGSGCRIWFPARVSVQVLEQLPASKAAQQLQIFYLCSFFAFSSLALLILQGLCATHFWPIASVF